MSIPTDISSLPPALRQSSDQEPELERGDELSLFRLLVPLLRQWRTIAGWTVGCATVATLGTIFLEPTYSASASFTLESKGSGLSLSGSLGGLASQLGVPIGGMGTSLTPDFYAALLGGRTIARELLATRFLPSGERATDSTSGRRLIDLWEIEGPSEAARWNNGIERLHDRLTTTIDRKAAIITVSVADASPMRAAAIANTAVGLLNRYNIEQLQSQSRRERQFAEDRLAEAQAEMRKAEDEQLRFLATNRTYSQSPALSVHLARLQRDVDQKQAVVMTLSRSYEEARIAEARDTPVLSIVERADVPTEQSFPKWWKFLMAGCIVGGGIGFLMAISKEINHAFVSSGRQDYLEFRATLRDAGAQFRQVTRRRSR